jgi:hypothetical protein
LWFLRRSAPFHPISVSGNAIWCTLAQTLTRKEI